MLHTVVLRAIRNVSQKNFQNLISSKCVNFCPSEASSQQSFAAPRAFYFGADFGTYVH